VKEVPYFRPRVPVPYFANKPVQDSDAKRQRDLTVWRKVRAAKLACSPVCEHCRQVPARDVHHIRPLSAGGALCDPDNLMAVCRKCHSRVEPRAV